MSNVDDSYLKNTVDRKNPSLKPILVLLVGSLIIIGLLLFIYNYQQKKVLHKNIHCQKVKCHRNSPTVKNIIHNNNQDNNNQDNNNNSNQQHTITNNEKITLDDNSNENNKKINNDHENDNITSLRKHHKKDHHDKDVSISYINYHSPYKYLENEDNTYTISSSFSNTNCNNVGYIGIDSCNNDRGTICWNSFNGFPWKIKWEDRHKGLLRIYQTQCNLNMAASVSSLQNNGECGNNYINKNGDLSNTYGWIHGDDFNEYLPRLWVGVSLLNYWQTNDKYSDNNNNHSQFCEPQAKKVSKLAHLIDNNYGPSTFRLISAKSIQNYAIDWDPNKGVYKPRKIILQGYKSNQFLIQNVQSGYYLFLEDVQKSCPNYGDLHNNNHNNVVILRSSNLRLKMVKDLQFNQLDQYVFTFNII